MNPKLSFETLMNKGSKKSLSDFCHTLSGKNHSTLCKGLCNSKEASPYSIFNDISCSINLFYFEIYFKKYFYIHRLKIITIDKTPVFWYSIVKNKGVF